MPADLGAGIFAWAQTVGPLTALLGAGDAVRLYPIATLSTKPLPVVIYEEEKDAEAARHDAPATAATSRVKFACKSATPEEATALHQALYGGVMVFRFGGDMGGVHVQAVLYESSSPAYEWEEQEWVVDAEYKFCYNL